MTRRDATVPMFGVASAVVLAGCFHVGLQAPPRDAPIEARVAAYQQLRPTGELHTITTNQSGLAVDHDIDLVTASGVTVKHADDLLPVLDERSPAARTARESARARPLKWYWILGGTAMAAVGFSLFDTTPGDDDRDRERLGWGLVLGGGIAAAVGYSYYRHVEVSRRAATFANYDEALRARLDLCIEGIHLVDCPASR